MNLGGVGTWILICAQTVDKLTVINCPQLSSQLLELELWVSPFPVPQFRHLYKQGYNISLRNLCCVGEKPLDKPKEFCNFKMFEIFECFDFCD